MAEDSGVTEAGLKAKLADILQATHVEIEDMSGKIFPTTPPLAFAPLRIYTTFKGNIA